MKQLKNSYINWNSKNTNFQKPYGNKRNQKMSLKRIDNANQHKIEWTTDNEVTDSKEAPPSSTS